MRILLDTNVVLDVLLEREPHVHESRLIWEAADRGDFIACLASFSLPTIHYICRRHVSREAAERAVDLCLEAFEICALYRECIIAARRMPGPDFEDNLQVACGITDFMNGIVTRNTQDYQSSPVRVYSPTTLLALINR